MNATYLNEIHALKKKKIEAVTHPSLPSLTKAEMDNNVVSSFQHSHFLPPESEKKRRL